MSWELIIGLIKPELFILVVFLYCLGLFLKKAPCFTAEWTIPFVLLLVSIIVTTLYMATVLGGGFVAITFVTGAIQGTMIASLTVFSNEILKQLGVKRTDDTTPWLKY